MWMCLTSRKGIEVPTISVQCTKFSKETFCFQADHQTPLIWCLVGKTQSVTTDLLTQKKKFSRSQSTSDRKEEGRGLTSGHYLVTAHLSGFITDIQSVNDREQICPDQPTLSSGQSRCGGIGQFIHQQNQQWIARLWSGLLFNLLTYTHSRTIHKSKNCTY